jgi:hypothetical protein
LNTAVASPHLQAQISQYPEWTALLFDDLGGARRGDLTFSEASRGFSRAYKVSTTSRKVRCLEGNVQLINDEGDR